MFRLLHVCVSCMYVTLRLVTLCIATVLCHIKGLTVFIAEVIVLVQISWIMAQYKDVLKHSGLSVLLTLA